MRPIAGYAVWVGNARDARDLRGLHDAGVAAIIDLAIEETPVQPTRELIYCRFPLLDGAGNSLVTLRTAIQTAAGLIHAAVPTLVACGGGMSRSPAIVAAALASLSVESLDQSLLHVARTGPHDVSPALWSEIHTALT